MRGRLIISFLPTVAAICQDLVQAARREDWRAAFPILARYGYELFDYRAEGLAP